MSVLAVLADPGEAHAGQSRQRRPSRGRSLRRVQRHSEQECSEEDAAT